MRKPVPMLMFLFATLGPTFSAGQVPGGTVPGFTLGLHAYYDHCCSERNIIALDVELKNTSRETIYESPCAAFGGLYKVSVVYNGVAVEEFEPTRKHREAMEKGEANGGTCFGSDPGRRAVPSEAAKDGLYPDSLNDTRRWRADKPGIYEFTVERKTFPPDPRKSVMVKSNTVTIAVPEPDFALTLSEGRPPPHTSLIVKMTMMAGVAISEDACNAFGGLYKLSVVYNGVPVEEPEEVRKRRESLEQAEAAGGMGCRGSVRKRTITTGESWDDWLDYDTRKPGIYEFTVERKTFPPNRERSVVIKSNTLTITVPKTVDSHLPFRQ